MIICNIMISSASEQNYILNHFIQLVAPFTPPQLNFSLRTVEAKTPGWLTICIIQKKSHQQLTGCDRKRAHPAHFRNVSHWPFLSPATPRMWQPRPLFCRGQNQKYVFFSPLRGEVWLTINENTKLSVYAASLSMEKRISAKYLRVSGKVPESGLFRMPCGDEKQRKSH